MRRHIIVEELPFGNFIFTALVWFAAAVSGYFTGDVFREYLVRLMGG